MENLTFRGGLSLSSVSNIFSQMLQLIPRRSFEQAVQRHQAERHAKGFTAGARW